MIDYMATPARKTKVYISAYGGGLSDLGRDFRYRREMEYA